MKPSYSKTTRAVSNCAGLVRNMKGLAAPSKSYSKMSDISGKSKLIYVDHMKDMLKIMLMN